MYNIWLGFEIASVYFWMFLFLYWYAKTFSGVPNLAEAAFFQKTSLMEYTE